MVEVLKTRRDFVEPIRTILKSGAEINAAILGVVNSAIEQYSATSVAVDAFDFAAAPGSMDDLYGTVSASDSAREVKLYYSLVEGNNTVSIRFCFVTDAALVYLPRDSRGMFADLPVTFTTLYGGGRVDFATVPVSFDLVADARDMFANHPYIKTIRVPAGTALRSSAASAGMFAGCTALVGGAGTAYNASHTDGEYARIDNPPDAPGYFTAAT